MTEKTLFRQPLRFTRRSFLFQYSPPKTPDTLCQKAFHTAFLKVSNATSIKQPNSHVSHRAFSIRSKPVTPFCVSSFLSALEKTLKSSKPTVCSTRTTRRLVKVVFVLVWKSTKTK